MVKAKAKDTGASVLQKKRSPKFFSGDFPKKKSSKFFFRRSPIAENKKRLHKFFARFLTFSNKILMVQKIVLSSSRGQGNFRGLKASKPRTSKCVLEGKDVLKDSTSGGRIVRCIRYISTGMCGLPVNIS